MKTVLLICTLALSSCITPKIDRRIYQPSVLILPPNTRIETTEGYYLSGDKIEKWFSQKKVDDLEKIISSF